MADIAISQLTYGLPSSTASIPFSQDGNTLRVAPSGLLVNVAKVGINTGLTPLTAELTLSRPTQVIGRESIELNVSSVIGDGYFDGLKFTQTAGTYNTLASMRCNVFSNGQAALVFSTRENTGTTLNASPMLTLDRNNGNVLNHGLILSGSPRYSDNTSYPDTGIVSQNVARGWYYGEEGRTTPTYVHILLPADFTNTDNQMFLLEIKGYNFGASGSATLLLNLMIGGYVTPASNGGPIRSVAVWSAQGDFAPTAYYSNTYNRGIARFYLSRPYYTSYAVNSMCVGNGRIIKPGELQIIYSSSATL
jgi:hypothetical protein